MQEEYLLTAVRLGNRICRDAIRHNNKCNWIAGTTEPNYKKSPKPYYKALKGDWYGGTSGIAYFLAHLYGLSHEALHKKIAIGAIRQALEALDSIKYGKLGFHSGITGIAYAAIGLGEQLNSEEFIDRGLALLHQLNQLPEKDYTLDVIDGCAGAIPALIKILRKYPSAPLFQLLDRMGAHLLKKAFVEPIGCSWKTLENGTSSNLTGFAHGASGIALALLELAHYRENDDYLDTASQGFAYEDSHFSEQELNWPDFRDMSMYQTSQLTQAYFAKAWCHGAPGIGLARLRAFELTGNTIYKQYAQQAIKTTVKHLDLPSLGNYSLCHGIFGNAELLIFASDILEDRQYLKIAEKAGQEMMQQVEKKGIPISNGTQTNYNVPDMMLGLSGIGYYYLRLYDPQKFDSVLMLN